MQAYTCIGIGVETASVLIAKAQQPLAARAPMWEKGDALDVVKLMSGLNGSHEAFASAGGDSTAGIHAALLKAAATNSNPQNTMALIAAAAAANSTNDVHEAPPLPPSEPAPAPPGSADVPPMPFEDPTVPANAGPSGSISFSLSSMMRSATPAARLDERSEQKEKSAAGMDSLRALISANKERSSATRAAMPAAARTSEAGKGLDFAGGEGEVRRDEGIGTMYMGGIPRGTGDGLILVESKKFGNVVDMFYEADTGLMDGGWAFVTFAQASDAAAAARRLSQRVSLFGATAPLEVRLGTSQDVEKVQSTKQARAEVAAATAGAEQGPAPGAASESKDDKNDKKRKRSRSRGRKRRDRSRRRRRRSSSSSSSSGAKKKRPAPTPTEPRKSSNFGSNFDANPPAPAAPLGAVPTVPSQMGLLEVPAGGRQVGVRGTWAEFATTDGRHYYVNCVNGEKTWAKPADFTHNKSHMGGQVSANGIPLHHSNLFIGSLPYGCSDLMFRQMFEPFGRVLSMKVVPEKRHGFVKFSCVPEAQMAIDTMNGVNINGTALSVKYASMGCH